MSELRYSLRSSRMAMRNRIGDAISSEENTRDDVIPNSQTNAQNLMLAPMPQFNMESGNNSDKLNYVSLLPNYSAKKEENFDFFIAQFEQVAQMAQWNDVQKLLLLKSKLHGDALQILAADFSMQSATSFDSLKIMLSDHFKTDKSLLQKQADFNAIRQLPGMTPRQLAMKLKSAAHLFLNLKDLHDGNGMSVIDTILLSRFCEALRDDVKWEVRKANPKTFEQAIDIAQSMDEIFTEKSLAVGMVSDSPSTTKLVNLIETQAIIQQQKFDQISNQINAVVNVPSTAPNYDNESKTALCIACGQPGHYLPSCDYFIQLQNLQATQTQKSEIPPKENLPNRQVQFIDPNVVSRRHKDLRGQMNYGRNYRRRWSKPHNARNNRPYAGTNFNQHHGYQENRYNYPKN